MISMLVACAATWWLLRSFKRERAFLLVALFLTWQFALKVASVVFLDNFGPIYSDEVSTEVGGFGSSAPLMILFVLVPLLALKIAMSRFPLRPSTAEVHVSGERFLTGDVLFGLLVAFVAGLYIDLFRIGKIPLLEGLERFEYKGGIFHHLLITYMFLVGYLIGFALARGRIVTGRWDTRFGGLVLLIFSYLFLTGHRFGSFYVLVAFALVPMAAYFIAPKIGIVMAPPASRRSLVQRLSTSRHMVTVFACCLIAIILVAMGNSLLNVRDGDAGEALLQRLLVQPVHMYWLTWERWQNNEIDGFETALNFMFNDPLDAARNTGIQYLMALHLGLSRASDVYEGQEVDYAGGYPEILLELGGVSLALLAAAVASAIVAWLYRVCVVSTCRGEWLVSVLSIYVCFGFLNLFLGGMINFLTAGSYWLKIGALFLAIAALRLRRRPKRKRHPFAPSPTLPYTTSQ